MSDEVIDNTEQVSTKKAVLQQDANLLDQVIAFNKNDNDQEVQKLLKGLSDAAMEGTVTWDKSVSRTLKSTKAAIDDLISKQLREIMHNEAFQKLEGSWRGLHHLVMESETGDLMQIKMFNADKATVHKDLDKALDFDQSYLFKQIYESEFGMPGGKPYGVMIGDYEFGNHPQDLEILEGMAGIAAAAFCPFITAPSPDLFGLPDWSDLERQPDLSMLFSGKRHIQWRSFREREDARFVTMTLPRVIGRKAYGKDTSPVESFDYEELLPDGIPKINDFCWFNSAYAMGTRLTNAFAQYGWCTAIRGKEGGGMVENLPVHNYVGEDGDDEVICPTEVLIPDRRSAEFDKLGFIGLSNFKNDNFSVFFGAQSTQKPKVYDDNDASENAQLSARLPYILAVSRISHCLKIMARDMIGSGYEAKDIEKRLTRWVMNFVNSNEDLGPEGRAQRPLKDAKIYVEPVPGQSGAYQAIAYLNPWVQMESLTTSMRLVARIPERKT